MPTAHQKQFEVQYVAQGHFDMQPGEPGIQTSDLPVTSPKPQGRCPLS